MRCPYLPEPLSLFFCPLKNGFCSYSTICLSYWLWLLLLLFSISMYDVNCMSHDDPAANTSTWEHTENASWDIVEHNEAWNCWVVYVFMAQDWWPEVSGLGMGHISSLWNSNKATYGLHWLKRCKFLGPLMSLLWNYFIFVKLFEWACLRQQDLDKLYDLPSINQPTTYQYCFVAVT